ncbi:MAG TPA: uroporphyrinogen-III synthase [Puia sp.]|jgi:uroporphyrinogen-III synthase|nr:uroporphyrinogen-III synthase [Puia sp.]
MESKPIYLLSTGLLPGGLIEEAAGKGIVLDAVAFIDSEAVEDNDLIARARELAGRRIPVVFTSVRAVEAVADWIAVAPGWSIFCIGGATRAAVAKYFGEKNIKGIAETAGALSRVIGGEKREVFFFCGEMRRDELPVILRESGVTVHEVIVYRTKLTPHVAERNYAGIAFFSPSAVESFCSVNVIAAGIPLFAIGATTAAAIRSRCTNPVITGEEPDKAMLIHKMTDHFLNNR